MQPTTIIIFVTAVIELLVGSVVLLQKNKDTSSKLFSLLAFVTSYWVFTNPLMTLQPWDFWVRNSYAAGVLVAPAALIWILNFVKEKFELKKYIIISTPAIVLFLLTYFTDLVIKDVQIGFVGSFTGTFGQLYPVYSLYSLVVVLYFLYLLVLHFSKSKYEQRSQLKYVVIGVFSFAITASFVSFFLPLFGVTAFIPIDSPSSIIFILAISYAIIRHHLFSVKLIAAELLTFAIWGLLLFDLFNKTTASEYIESGVVLTLVVIAGTFLLRSVKKEVAQREEIEQLAGRLKSVNRIMSHDIKNVLGKNKDMFGMLLDGSFGALSESARGFLERVHDDTKKLIRSVIVILESGQELKLKPAPFDLKEAVLEVVHDTEPDAKAKGLALTTALGEKDTYTITADRTQLVTHVLRNLIENAIHYTLAGSVTVGLSKKDANTVLFSVTDTGIGIADEDKPNIFKEGGHGKDSIKVNVHSTGYGLYSVKRIVDAHGGKVWFETEMGKGTTFWVELGVKG